MPRAPGTGGASHRHRAPAARPCCSARCTRRSRPHAGRLLRRLLCGHVPDHRSQARRARCWSRSRSAAAARCPMQDGASAHSSGMHNNSNIPIEMIESDMRRSPSSATACCPIPAVPAGSAADSACGASGGSIVLRRSSPPTRPLQFRPFGLAGGEPASLSALVLTRDGYARPLPPKVGRTSRCSRATAAAGDLGRWRLRRPGDARSGGAGARPRAGLCLHDFDPRAHRLVAEQRWFEDFALGERFPLPSRTMTSGLFAAFQAASATTTRSTTMPNTAGAWPAGHAGAWLPGGDPDLRRRRPVSAYGRGIR